VIKVHGSVDWWRPIRGHVDWPINADHGAIATQVIARAATLDISSEYVFDRAPLMAGWPQQPPMFPALAIPVEEKDDFECPATHIDYLKSAIGETSKILFIGWRARDLPFLKLLRDHLSPFRSTPACVVAGRDRLTRDVVDQLSNSGINANDFFLEGGFSEFVMHRAGEQFLSTDR
jgi:hypothetical protein